MNRRGFIASVLALVADPAIPAARAGDRFFPTIITDARLPEGTIFFANRLWMFSGQTVSYSEPLDPMVWK